MGSDMQTGRQETAAPAIELKGISKAFGPVQANKDISLTVARGTIPTCNIVCITGDEMKADAQGYLHILFDQNPQSVGGALPADDFYVPAQ